jgi:hypothetical protein
MSAAPRLALIGLLFAVICSVAITTLGSGGSEPDPDDPHASAADRAVDRTDGGAAGTPAGGTVVDAPAILPPGPAPMEGRPPVDAAAPPQPASPPPPPALRGHVVRRADRPPLGGVRV